MWSVVIALIFDYNLSNRNSISQNMFKTRSFTLMSSKIYESSFMELADKIWLWLKALNHSQTILMISISPRNFSISASFIQIPIYPTWLQTTAVSNWFMNSKLKISTGIYTSMFKFAIASFKYLIFEKFEHLVSNSIKAYIAFNLIDPFTV